MYAAPKIAAGSDVRFVVPEHVKPIRDKVLRFVEDRVYPVERQTGEARRRSMQALKEEAKRQGLWALGHPKEIGGHGMPFRDYIYVNEVQGRSELAPACLGTGSLQDSLMLYNHASAEIKQRYLAGIVAGDISPSFAMTEPELVSSDPTGIQTRAELVGGEWVINGRKWFTSNARNAAFTTVMCRTDAAGAGGHAAFSMIVVPTDTPGYNIVRSPAIMGREWTPGGMDHSEVVYDNVRVPKSHLLGPRGAGFLLAQQRLGPGRIFHCMRFIGQMQRAFDLMCERLHDRKLPGGKRLGEQQLMQQHIYDSYTDIQTHRLLTLAAAEKVDQGGYARIELAACKSYGARMLCRVLDRALQCWGAKGLTDDTPLSEMYRRARESRFYDGPDETHIQSVGRLVLKEYAAGRRWDFSEGAAVPNPRPNVVLGVGGVPVPKPKL